MTGSDVSSHFWIAGQPFFVPTLFVVPPPDITAETTPTSLEFFDVDGSKTNVVDVDFPTAGAGVIELEPFMSGMKTESGFIHGHLAVSSPIGARHILRLVSGGATAMVQDPMLIRSRESTFLPLTLSTSREQMLCLVNSGNEPAQITCRMFYGHRSPEWNIVVAPNGAKVVAVHEEFLATQDDKSWEKGAVQSYIRITARHQTSVSCCVIERTPGESIRQDGYRCLTAW